MGTLVVGAIVLAVVIVAIKTIKKDGIGCDCGSGCSGNCRHCSQTHHTEK